MVPSVTRPSTSGVCNSRREGEDSQANCGSVNVLQETNDPISAAKATGHSEAAAVAEQTAARGGVYPPSSAEG